MTLRAVTFADPRADVWGAAWALHPDLPSFAIVGPDPGAIAAAELAGDGPSGEWRITAEGLELTVTPETAGTPDQLVMVRGRVSGRALECPGARSERPDAIEPGRLSLARDVSAWFAPGEGFAVIAIRPKKASGHGGEHAEATRFAGGHGEPVAEPRLSTTYNEHDQPIRATLELWLPEHDERADDQEGTSVQYPHRAAGRAAGAGITHAQDRVAVLAQPFRWRAERRDGAGVYLLARAQ